MDFKSRYQNAHKIFLNLEEEIQVDILASLYKNSLSVIYNKVKAIDLIKDAIEKANEPYSINILYRSMLEHYFLGYYVYIKAKIDNSDKVGSDYFESYLHSEKIKQETYIIQLERMEQKQKDLSVSAEDLRSKFPLLKLTQKELSDYHEGASQFVDIRKIGRYLLTNKDFEPKLPKIHEILFQQLKDYNLLSSFVHGGPMSDKECARFKTDSDYTKHILNRSTDWAYLLATLIKIYLILFLRDEHYDKYAAAFTKMYKE